MIQLNNENKVEDTGTIQIYSSSLIYDDSVIQLCNISRITVAPLEKTTSFQVGYSTYHSWGSFVFLLILYGL